MRACVCVWCVSVRVFVCVVCVSMHTCTLTHIQMPNFTQVWDLSTLDLVRSLEGHTDAVRALAVTEGRLFSGSYDASVHVWDEASLQCIKVGHCPARFGPNF